MYVLLTLKVLDKAASSWLQDALIYNSAGNYQPVNSVINAFYTSGESAFKDRPTPSFSFKEELLGIVYSNLRRVTIYRGN